MVKILIFDTNEKKAERMRQLIRELLMNAHYPFDLHTYFSVDVVLKNINENPFVYNIIIMRLDENSTIAAQVSSLVREKNLSSALVYYSKEKSDLDGVLLYRPSAFFAYPGAVQPFCKILLNIYREQMKLKQHFYIRNKSGVERIFCNDIEYFESSQRYVHLYELHKDRRTFIAKLDDVFSQLSPCHYLRCHQSYIINMSHVNLLDKANRVFKMRSGREISISKSNTHQVITAFEDYVQRLS